MKILDKHLGTPFPPHLTAILALAALVPAPSIGVWMGMWALPGSAGGEIIWVLSKIRVVALPLIWLLYVDRRKISLSPPRQGGLGTGAALVRPGDGKLESREREREQGNGDPFRSPPGMALPFA